jgi:hypothetical protein
VILELLYTGGRLEIQFPLLHSALGVMCKTKCMNNNLTKDKSLE